MLLAALAVSIIGTTLQVWHRHGGPAWAFVLGGFFFILGRLLIALTCAYFVLVFFSMSSEMDGQGFVMIGLPTLLISAIGLWSLFVTARAVYRDAFGSAQEQAARAR